MKILFLGDLVGRTARQFLCEKLPHIRTLYAPDFVIVNAENTSEGMGLSPAHAQMILEAGADAITLGDHAFDQKGMISFIETEPRILRPINYAHTAPGHGAHVFIAQNAQKILVVQILGQVFMRQPFANPFQIMETILQKYRLGQNVDAIFVDFHAETTSEKTGMGLHLDGRVSAVIGTHTHIPTSDTQILEKGTAFQADAGMSGCYRSVIGMDKEEPLRRFVTGMSGGRFVPSDGDVTLAGVWLETNRTGQAQSILPFRMGGHLIESLPSEISNKK